MRSGGGGRGRVGKGSLYPSVNSTKINTLNVIKEDNVHHIILYSENLGKASSLTTHGHVARICL